MRAATAVMLAVVGCGSAATPARDGEAGLRATLVAARRDPGAAVAAMRLDAAAWERTVVAAYRARHRDYDRGYAVASAGVAAALAHPGPVTVRRHYADDPRLAAAQRRERLALPVGRAAWIASVDGRDVPAVFVWDGAAWRALVGVDALTRDAVGARDHDCAVAYSAARDGACLDASAPVAVAAVADDAPGLAIACRRLIALAAGGACASRDSVAPAAPP